MTVVEEVKKPAAELVPAAAKPIKEKKAAKAAPKEKKAKTAKSTKTTSHPPYFEVFYPNLHFKSIYHLDTSYFYIFLIEFCVFNVNFMFELL